MTNLEKFYDEIERYLKAQDWGTTCALNDCLNTITEREVFCSNTSSRICERRADCLAYNLAWLKKEYKEPVLDSIEKNYLRGIIAPFRNDIDYIEKVKAWEYDGIIIRWNNGCGEGSINLPLYDKGEMYKGMEYKAYTLKELGL